MPRSQDDALRCLELATNGQADLRAGTLVGLTPDGQPLVDHPGNPGGPIPARTIVPSLEASRDAEGRGLPVLLVFEDGDPLRPIILGVIRRTLASAAPGDEPRDLPSLPTPVAFLDGERLVLEAKEEIVLLCGKGSITLRKDGKVVIQGTHLVSRARGTNAIRGGSVKIN